MNNRQAREMLALRRELDELRRSFELLRKTPPPTASSFARAAILQPVATIPGRVADGAAWDVSHGAARVYDLLVRSGTDPWVLSEVKPATGDGPQVELANPFGSPLPAGAWVMGIQIVGQAWVAISEPIRLVRFTLTANLTTSPAAASIKLMDGAAAGTDEVLDPEGAFTALVTGNNGFAINQDGEYYVIQAPCPGTGSNE